VIPPPVCSHIITQWSNEVSVNINTLAKSSFINQDTGWIAGSNGIILNTNNGGLSFSQQNSGTSQYISSISFLDEFNGFAAGGDSSGIVLKTINGGITWTPELNNIEKQRALYFFNKDMGFVAGDSGIMRKTTDAGQSWNIINTGFNFSIYDIQFVDNNIGYACGANGRIIKSTDGGQSWTPLSNTMPQNFNDAYLSLDFLDANNGYLGGFSYSDSSGYVIKTSDGGQTWSYMNTNYISFEDIKMVDNNTAYVVGGNINGSNGGIYKVTNGNILTLDKASSAPLYDFSFLGCDAIVSGTAGIIIQGTE
jgi:photosystem II stability/assembly factor-like uncharacterized protein